jgi:hypothetical protein
MNTSEIVKSVWLPFSPSLRHARLDATTRTFAGQGTLRTPFGETQKVQGTQDTCLAP